MKDKLKCPFCQTELEDAGIHSAELYFCCTNCYMKQKEKDDNYTASPRIWQALQIAHTALKDITIVRCGLEDFEPKAVTMTRIAEKALEQIEHKEIQAD